MVSCNILPLLRVRWLFHPQSSHSLRKGLRLSTIVLNKFYGGCFMLYLSSRIGDPRLYAVFKNAFWEKWVLDYEKLCSLVFMGCENFMKFLSHHDRSCFLEQEVSLHIWYTLERCATFLTNVLSLVTQPGVCPFILPMVWYPAKRHANRFPSPRSYNPSYLMSVQSILFNEFQSWNLGSITLPWQYSTLHCTSCNGDVLGPLPLNSSTETTN
jgi:hypothetical protein